MFSQRLHEAIIVEGKAIPPAKKFWSRIDAAPANKFVTSRQVDWGRKSRGQGKRVGGMVMGGMSDAPQGVKTYSNILGSARLSTSDANEAAGLEKIQQAMLARALAAGYGPKVAFLVAYTVGLNPISRSEAYRIISSQ